MCASSLVCQPCWMPVTAHSFCTSVLLLFNEISLTSLLFQSVGVSQLWEKSGVNVQLLLCWISRTKQAFAQTSFSFFLTSLSSPENYSMMRRKKKWKWDLRKKITSSPPFLCNLGTDTQSWMEIIIHAGNFTPCHVTHCRLTLTEFLNISIMSNNITLIISFSMDFLDTILNENILSLILKCHMCVSPLYP